MLPTKVSLLGGNYEKLAREGILISMNSHILEMSRKLRKEQMTLQEYTQQLDDLQMLLFTARDLSYSLPDSIEHKSIIKSVLKFFRRKNG